MARNARTYSRPSERLDLLASLSPHFYLSSISSCFFHSISALPPQQTMSSLSSRYTPSFSSQSQTRQTRRFGRHISFGSSSEEESQDEDEEEESPITSHLKAKASRSARASIYARTQARRDPSSQLQLKRPPPTVRTGTPASPTAPSASVEPRSKAHRKSRKDHKSAQQPQASLPGPVVVPSSELHVASQPQSLHVTPLTSGRPARTRRAPPPCDCCDVDHAASPPLLKTSSRPSKHRRQVNPIVMNDSTPDLSQLPCTPPPSAGSSESDPQSPGDLHSMKPLSLDSQIPCTPPSDRRKRLLHSGSSSDDECHSGYDGLLSEDDLAGEGVVDIELWGSHHSQPVHRADTSSCKCCL